MAKTLERPKEETTTAVRMGEMVDYLGGGGTEPCPAIVTGFNIDGRPHLLVMPAGLLPMPLRGVMEDEYGEKWTRMTWRRRES